MKDQYFGDVNDYRKYGLLRQLTDAGATPLTIAWMLTPSDGRSDGNRIAYLSDPHRYRGFDPPLFDALHQAIRRRRRSVTVVREDRLLPSARTLETIVPDDPVGRAEYHKALRRLVTPGGLLFLDPDNGLEVASKPCGRRDSSKYVYWKEIEDLYGLPVSLTIYQHFPRVRREQYMALRCGEIFRRLRVRFLLMYRTDHVLFILVPERGKERLYERRSKTLCGRWKREFQVLRAEPSADGSVLLGELR